MKDILGPVLKKYGLAQAKIGIDEGNMVFMNALKEFFPTRAACLIRSS